MGDLIFDDGMETYFVIYLEEKNLCCLFKDGAGMPSWGPKVNFPIRTLNKIKSF